MEDSRPWWRRPTGTPFPRVATRKGMVRLAVFEGLFAVVFAALVVWLIAWRGPVLFPGLLGPAYMFIGGGLVFRQARRLPRG